MVAAGCLYSVRKEWYRGHTMVWFLLFSAPLTVVATAILLGGCVEAGGDSFSRPSYMLVRYAVLPGIFLFVAMYIVFLALGWVVPFRYSREGLFLFYLVTDFVSWTIMVLAGAVLVARGGRGTSNRDKYHIQLLFAGMILGLFAAAEFVMHDGYRTVYQILLRPLSWAGMIVLYPLVLERGRRGRFSLKEQWQWIIPPAYCAGWASVAMWSEWLRPTEAAMGAAGMVCFTLGSVLLMIRFPAVPTASAPTSAPASIPVE